MEKMVNLEDRSEGQEVIKVVEEEEEVVFPGFRFHPTDEELVGFYLRRKVEKKRPLSIDIIKEVDIYKYDPWELPKLSTFGEKEWYFFCLRGRKYRNSIRPNRVTGSGFWKATGIDRPIYSGNNSCDIMGLKKSLVYYRGSAGKGTKTDWMMHEFRLPSCNQNPPSINETESWTICRIFKRNVSFKKYTQQVSWKDASGRQTPAESSSKTSSFESDAGEEYRYLQGGTSFQQGESYVKKYMEENGQLYAAGNLNIPHALANNTINVQSNFMNLNGNEVFREGNWDEIGRMVDYMVEPATTYDCIYY